MFFKRLLKKFLWFVFIGLPMMIACVVILAMLKSWDWIEAFWMWLESDN